ncbi:hypothetical protein PTKU46_59760 [Paraburkholderia terrae]
MFAVVRAFIEQAECVHCRNKVRRPVTRQDKDSDMHRCPRFVERNRVYGCGVIRIAAWRFVDALCPEMKPRAQRIGYSIGMGMRRWPFGALLWLEFESRGHGPHSAA